VHAGHSLQFSVGNYWVLCAGHTQTTGTGVLGWVRAGLKDATATASGAATVVVLLLLFDERFHFQIQIFYTKDFKINIKNSN